MLQNTSSIKGPIKSSPTTIKNPLDSFLSRFPELQKLGFIKRYEELNLKKSQDLQPVRYIKNFLCNSAGEFYKIEKNDKNAEKFTDHYTYFYEIPADTAKIRISGNSVGTGLSEKASKWPISNFFYTSSDNNFFKSEKKDDFEIDFSQKALDPFSSGINCYRLEISLIVNEFISIIDCISKPSPTQEFDVPQDFLDAKLENTKLLLTIHSEHNPEQINSKLKVEAFAYDTDKATYFKEIPVAEALYDEEPLSKSKIRFGKLVKEGKEYEARCIWGASSRTKVYNNGQDFQDFIAVCFSPAPVKKPFPLIDPLYNHRFLKPLKKWNIEGLFVISVPVYKKVNDKKDIFIWNQPHLVKPEFFFKEKEEDAEPALKFNTRHSLYPNLFDSYSLEDIYKSIDCFDYITPEKAARKIARALCLQPRGRRSISIEGGALKQLMGGAIQLSDNITKLVRDEKNPEIRRSAKILKNYLSSMVYFEKDEKKRSAANTIQKTDELCGDGYIFYDAPIHIDAPKIQNIDKELACLYVKRLKKLYKNYKTPISGCEAIRDLLTNIFQKIKSYGIKIDYVYSDFEGMRNTAKEIKASGRVYYLTEDGDKPNTENLALASTYQIWQSIWQSLNERQNDKTEGHRNILNNLLERGFVPNVPGDTSCELYEVKACSHSDENNEASSSGYNFYPSKLTYAMRRNINIWDCVMMEYTAGWFNKYLVEPVRICSPQVKPSMHALNYQAGYINHHQHAEEFETYLGGSIKLVSNMRSNPCLYTLKMDIFEKDSMDNWKTYIPEITPFERLTFYVNNIRAATQSNPCIGVQPIISTQYTWNNDIANRDKKASFTQEDLQKVQDNYPYYKEMLIHMWMSKPEITYAYPHYNNDAKDVKKILQTSPSFNEADFKEYSTQKYFEDVLGNYQNIINEMDRILPSRAISEIITNNIIPQNSPFIFSGWRIGNFKIFRISLSNKNRGECQNVRYIRPGRKKFIFTKFPRRKKILRIPIRPLEIPVDGKTIVIPGGYVVKTGRQQDIDKDLGFWVVTKSHRKPYIRTDHNYYEDHPSLLTNGNVNIIYDYKKKTTETEVNGVKKVTTEKIYNQTIRVPDNTSVFGDIAREQKWEVHVKGNDATQITELFGHSIKKFDCKIDSKKDYLFEASINLNKNFTNKQWKPEENSITIRCIDANTNNILQEKELNPTSPIDEFNPRFPDRLLSKLPILKGPENSEDMIPITSLKATIQGANIRVDIYREDDGINIGRVNEDNTNSKFKKTKPGDKILLKVSWLNATNFDITYILQYEFTGRFLLPLIIKKPRLIRKKTFTIPAGSEGYQVLHIGAVPFGAKKIKATILKYKGLTNLLTIADERSAKITNT